MQLSHLDEIRQVHFETGLRQAFGNAYEIEAVFPGGIDAVHNQQRRRRRVIAVDVDRNAGMLNGSMTDGAFPRIERGGITYKLQGKKPDQKCAADYEEKEYSAYDRREYTARSCGSITSYSPH